MSSEGEMFSNLEQAILLLGILGQGVSTYSSPMRSLPTYPSLQILQDFDFYKCLMMETLLVSYDFHCDHVASGVVAAAQDLAERAFAQGVHNLVSI